MSDDSASAPLPETEDGGRWRTVLYETDEIHVFPIDDLVEHEVDGGNCVCGVEAELLEDDPEETPDADTADTWLFTHHSLDGREKDE